MKNLEKELGLPVSLEGTELKYDKKLFDEVPKTRTFNDAKEVYLSKTSEVDNLYFMYRYFEEEGEEAIFDKNQLEYDVTVLNSGKVGEEFIKTAGHYHRNVEGLNLTYPEVYEVVEGKIEYLLQTKPNENGEVKVIWVIAEKGDKVIVPPNYGHVSLNSGTEVAVESNLQEKDLPATADYQSFKDYVGGALFRSESGLTENNNYKITSLRIVIPKEKPEWALTSEVPLYTAFINNPEKFDFLVHPQNYEFDLDELFEDAEL